MTNKNNAEENSQTRVLAKGVGLGLLLFAVVAGAYTLGNRGSGDEVPGAAATSTTVAAAADAEATTLAPTGDTTAPPETAAVVETTAPTTVAPTPTAPEGASLVATLDSGAFTLTGVVPDEETATRLVEAATIAYGAPDVSGLQIDPDVPAAPWLENAHVGITLIPMINEGSIAVMDGQIDLAGSSGQPEWLEAFAGTVSQVFGIENVNAEVEITNQVASLFDATRTNGQLVLTGVMPTSEIRDLVVGGALLAYGPDAVDDQLTVSDERTTSFWMYTMPGVFDLFAPFQDYSIHVEDGITTGTIRSGVTFDTGSAVLTEQAQAVLGVGVALLVRDQRMGMSVVGHTDSRGSDASNQELSEARANSVLAFFEAAGIDPARLVASGAGESTPIADNETDEGRELNRRVEFEFGPAAGILGG